MGAPVIDRTPLDEANDLRREAVRAEQWLRTRLAQHDVSQREAQAIDDALRGIIGFKRAMLRLISAIAPPMDATGG